jgi:predicted patatin/cPLA2 family phospholipase
MHPVVRHLLARKNKSVPVSDGRRIALVLYGGAMASIQGAGAMIAFRELGLTHAFDDIYASSAGFCNASYLLSGNPQEGASLYYDELSGRKFLDLRRVWNMADIEYVVENMERKKPLHPHKILSCATRLFAQVKSEKNKTEFLEVHRYQPSRYFTLMEAAIKMPYLSPGAVSMGSSKFKDILWDADWLNLLKQAVLSPATDIVVIYNRKVQRDYIHEHCTMSVLKNDVLEIIPGASREISRLETRPKVLRRACLETGTLVKHIFGSKKKIDLAYSPSLPDRPYRGRSRH